MLDTILISGLSGLLIVLMVMGIGKIALIDKKRKEGLPLKESIRLVLGTSVWAWLLTIYALLIVVMLVSGLVISIVMG